MDKNDLDDKELDHKDLENKDLPETSEQSGKDVTLSGQQLITLLIFFPIVVVWLLLAGRIIWSATSNPETLDNIEPLLLALAVLSIPVSGGLAEILKAYSSGDKK
tara:strand:+ start:694 stop:1008 length:315 start_codon:yes stop_codon:yes gene_type:complete